MPITLDICLSHKDPDRQELYALELICKDTAVRDYRPTVLSIHHQHSVYHEEKQEVPSRKANLREFHVHNVKVGVQTIVYEFKYKYNPWDISADPIGRVHEIRRFEGDFREAGFRFNSSSFLKQESFTKTGVRERTISMVQRLEQRLYYEIPPVSGALKDNRGYVRKALRLITY